MVSGRDPIIVRAVSFWGHRSFDTYLNFSSSVRFCFESRVEGEDMYCAPVIAREHFR